MNMGQGVYWVEVRDGRVECPRCHSIIDVKNFNNYELIDRY